MLNLNTSALRFLDLLALLVVRLEKPWLLLNLNERRLASAVPADALLLVLCVPYEKTLEKAVDFLPGGMACV